MNCRCYGAYAAVLQLSLASFPGTYETLNTVVTVLTSGYDVAEAFVGAENTETVGTDNIECGQYDILFMENNYTYLGKTTTVKTVFVIGNSYPFLSVDGGNAVAGPAVPIVYSFTSITRRGIAQTIYGGCFPFQQPEKRYILEILD